MTEQPADASAPIVPSAVCGRPPRSRRRTILLGLAILACGFILGAGVTVVAVVRIVDMIHTPGEVPKRISERMQSKFDLTDQETEKIRAILARREKAIGAHLMSVYPGVERELNEAREEVADTLTPEQAREWREWFDHRQKKWKRKWLKYRQAAGKTKE